MDRKLYQELASRIGTVKSLEQSPNTEVAQHWAPKSRALAEELVECLPHGSGIDGQTRLDWDRSNAERIVITGSYHAMNDAGYYDGWYDFTATIRPSLAHGMVLSITGRFGKYQDAKDYIAESWQYALERTCTVSFDDSGKPAVTVNYD